MTTSSAVFRIIGELVWVFRSNKFVFIFVRKLKKLCVWNKFWLRVQVIFNTRNLRMRQHLNSNIKKRPFIFGKGLLIWISTWIDFQLPLFLLRGQRGIRIILGLQLLFSRHYFRTSQPKTRQLLADTSCAASRRRVWIWIEIVRCYLTSLPLQNSTSFELSDFDWVDWRANTHPVILMRLLRIEPHFVLLLTEDVVCHR
jgi:hypothetical protein